VQTAFLTPTTTEKKMAVLAHASILITFVVAATTGGIGVLAAMLLPLFIWFIYRDSSAYVAFHALQATLFQLGIFVLTLLLSAVLGAVLTIAWILTALLSIILVGLLLAPITLFLTILVGIVLAIIPLVSLAYGLVGAWEVYNSANFRYYWIADWLEARL